MKDRRKQLLEDVSRVGRRLPTGVLERLCLALDEFTGTSDELPRLVERLGWVPDATAREGMIRLVREWYAADPGQAGASLAWALRGACATDDWWRKSSGLELVWTGPAPASGVLRRTEQALLEVIGVARSDLWLVCFAGYKGPAIRDALLAAARRGVEIRLVIADPEVSQGKVTYSILEGVGSELACHATVYVWPLDRRERSETGQHGSLHVKCTLADEDVLFVTSANLTEFAMRLNMELGLLVRGGSAPKRMGDHLRWLVSQRVLEPVRSDQEA